jgi:predicted RNA-binding protein YlxR (DUF448 family)
LKSDADSIDDQPRPAPTGKKRIEDRRCIAAGDALGPSDPALRFVLGPDGEIVADLKGKLPGRGAWLTPERGALLSALKKGAFARAFRTSVPALKGQEAEAFADKLEAQLQEQALRSLGLARKAGALTIGHDLVRNEKRPALAYLTPADASPAERDKLAGLLHKRSGLSHFSLPADRIAVGHALGQDAVHLLLLARGPGPGALHKLMLWQRFAG